jgi:predicted unusual protein kinase regulating ubiquinone biosynthesis (AarF/ABC1/UbiB family)
VRGGAGGGGLAGAARALGLLQAWQLARLAASLGWLWLRTRGERGEELRRRRRVEATRRVVATLGELKGPFVKAGQFAAVRLDLVPAEAQPVLASLRDRVAPRPLAEVRAVVESELGEPLEARFRAFEPEPLGAASIAQVHRAELHDGTPVAVKVQYAWLARSLRADLFWLRLLLRALAGRRGRRFDAGRLFDEFARGMAEELDFEREAASARAIAANLAAEPQIVVPEVFAEHTTRRVLTVRFHPCVSVNDREGLARLGVDAGAVVAPIARAYSKQVFVDGLFHADPHPGNLFVLDEPGAAGRPRILFVDFGLSRRLDPTLRDEIRKAVYALMQRDPDAFLAGMERMGMVAPGREAAVAGSVRRMFERLSGVGGPASLGAGQVLDLKDEAKALLQETPGVQLPNDLLLYARTMTYVFGLAQELDPDADVMKLCLPPLLRFLAQRPEAPPAPG